MREALKRLQGLVTRRFYLVLCLGVVCLITASATGFDLFLRLAYILALAALLSFWLNWQTMRDLTVTVDRRTRRARVGDTVEERITVRNSGNFPKGILEVRDLTDMPGFEGGAAVGVPGSGFRSWLVQAPARKRGMYTLGPVQISNSDPFGLFQRERRMGTTAPLTVYPRVFRLPTFVLPPADLSGESSMQKRTHDLTPHASSVREYAFGDSLSRIHWNSTARLGRLMSKEFDLGRASDVWIVLDLQRDVQAGELEESTDEYAVTAAASVAQKYLDANLPVGLIAHGDRSYHLSAETGPGQMDRLMDTLATCQAEGEVALSEALSRDEGLWSHFTSLVVITSSHLTDWVVALRELNKRRVRVAVVFVDSRSFGGYFETDPVLESLQLEGIVTYLVRKGDHMPTSLSNPYSLAPHASGQEAVATGQAT